MPRCCSARKCISGWATTNTIIIGGLLGEPLQLVRCKTVDLEVPAQAEIVLEGELDPSDLIDEGPVSEFHGFYVDYGPGIGADINCVTHREDAHLPGDPARLLRPSTACSAAWRSAPPCARRCSG